MEQNVKVEEDKSSAALLEQVAATDSTDRPVRSTGRKAPSLREMMKKIEERQDANDVKTAELDARLERVESGINEVRSTIAKMGAGEDGPVRGITPKTSRSEIPSDEELDDAPPKPRATNKPSRPRATKNTATSVMANGLVDSEEDLKRTKEPPASAPPAPTKSDTSLSPMKKAKALLKASDFEGAVALLKTIIDDKQSDQQSRAEAQYWTGTAYYRLAKYDKAVDHFRLVTAVKNSSKMDDAYFGLGQSYFRLGQMPQSQKAFEKLRTLFPKSPFDVEARQMLQRIAEQSSGPAMRADR